MCPKNSGVHLMSEIGIPLQSCDGVFAIKHGTCSLFVEKLWNGSERYSLGLKVG